MRESWQPYPNHPRVREITDLLADLYERALQAAVTGDVVTASVGVEGTPCGAGPAR